MFRVLFQQEEKGPSAEEHDKNTYRELFLAALIDGEESVKHRYEWKHILVFIYLNWLLDCYKRLAFLFFCLHKQRCITLAPTLLLFFIVPLSSSLDYQQALCSNQGLSSEMVHCNPPNHADLWIFRYVFGHVARMKGTVPRDKYLGPVMFIRVNQIRVKPV